MAEIKITKKSTVWPWVLLIVIILAVLAFLFFYGNEEDDVTTDDTTTEFEEVTSINSFQQQSILSEIEYS